MAGRDREIEDLRDQMRRCAEEAALFPAGSRARAVALADAEGYAAEVNALRAGVRRRLHPLRVRAAVITAVVGLTVQVTGIAGHATTEVAGTLGLVGFALITRWRARPRRIGARGLFRS